MSHVAWVIVVSHVARGSVFSKHIICMYSLICMYSVK